MSDLDKYSGLLARQSEKDNQLRAMRLERQKMAEAVDTDDLTLYPHFVIELYTRHYFVDMSNGRVMGGPLMHARIYSEEEIAQAVSEAKMVGGKVRVIYLTEPITLQEFCDRKDTWYRTRERCVPFVNLPETTG